MIVARMKETVCYIRLASTQKQYPFGLTQKISFDIFKKKKVPSQYLLCIAYEIKQLSEISNWHYIPSEQNLTDLYTKTQTDFKLIQQKWFYGPETTLQKALDLKEINIRNQFEENLRINISLTTHNSKAENCKSYQIIKWDSYSS